MKLKKPNCQHTLSTQPNREMHCKLPGWQQIWMFPGGHHRLKSDQKKKSLIIFSILKIWWLVTHIVPFPSLLGMFWLVAAFISYFSLMVWWRICCCFIHLHVFSERVGVCCPLSATLFNTYHKYLCLQKYGTLNYNEVNDPEIIPLQIFVSFMQMF